MAQLKIDPFEYLRKNAHLWQGENSLMWYSEGASGGSFTILILYDFGEKKQRLLLEIDNKTQKVEFKNETIDLALYQNLLEEIMMLKKLFHDPI